MHKQTWQSGPRVPAYTFFCQPGTKRLKCQNLPGNPVYESLNCSECPEYGAP